MRRSCGRTGVEESTDAPVSSSCAKSRVEIQVGPPTSASLAIESASLSRAERAHARLSWTERLARNARPETSGRVTIRLFGVPEHVATSLGLVTACICVCLGRRASARRGATRASANSATRFTLRSRDPVERLVRDAVLSEKEAQLGCMFLHVTHGVQLELYIA